MLNVTDYSRWRLDWVSPYNGRMESAAFNSYEALRAHLDATKRNYGPIATKLSQFTISTLHSVWDGDVETRYA